MDYRELLDMSIKVLENAYSPYSKVRVAAALLTDCGKVFLGVNVENASYGATCCAERTAIGTAVTEGYTKFKAIAISSSLEKPILPCGICRQVILEFSEDIDVIIGDENEYKVYKMGDLLGHSFKKTDLSV